MHGRHTHDPARTRNALAILTPTTDEGRAADQINEFFESGWVGWDVKTAVELTCGTVRGRLVARPLACLHVTRQILLEHELSEEKAYRRYTIMTYAAILPGGLAAVMVVHLVLAARRRAREREPKRDVA
ncbi:MAG: hypothetical protein JST00_47100 [Deltaproteobacteria bacterium]|nr:hypothetical protein [Deltaproteobacteria bacterium]